MGLSDFISPKEIKWYIIGVLLTSLVAVGITIIVILSGRPKPSTITKEDFNDPFSYQVQSVDRPLVISDIFLPQEQGAFIIRDPLLLRNPHFPWTQGEVERFWIDPRDVGKDLLEEEFQNQWQDYLEEIP